MSVAETIHDKNRARGGNASASDSDAIRCYLDAAIMLRTSRTILSGDRLLAAQAMSLLLRLDTELREARADWNQDRFRRIMRARPKAVFRLQRRYSMIAAPPTVPLGSLRRRYHANLAKYLYGS